MTLCPYDFARTVALSGAAYPHSVRVGKAQGTPYAVDADEIAANGVTLLDHWHHADSDTEFYAGIDADIAHAIELVFRGTTTLPDWKANLRFSLVPWNAGIAPTFPLDAGRVHAGHYACCRAVAPIIRSVIESHPHNRTIHVRGHSLGGSEATLVAIALACRYPRKDIILSTIAAPRSGDAKLVKFALSLPNLTIHRYYHVVFDTIVHLPPWLQGYRHLPGIPIWEFGGHLVASYHESSDIIMRKAIAAGQL